LKAESCPKKSFQKQGDRRSLKTTRKLALREGEVGEVSNYFRK